MIRLVAILASFCLAIGFMNCGQFQTGIHSLGNSTSSSFVASSQQEQKAIQILTVNCASCHGTTSSGGISDITDPPHLIQTGLIIPGNPTASTLIQAVQSNAMPPGAPLAGPDKQALADYVTSLNASPVVPTPTPGATPVPTPPPMGTTVTGVQLYMQSCQSCHGQATAFGPRTVAQITNALQTQSAMASLRNTLNTAEIQAISDALSGKTTTVTVGGTTGVALPTPTPALTGADLYALDCRGCHNKPPSEAKSASGISDAIRSVSAMKGLSGLTTTQIQMIADYVKANF